VGCGRELRGCGHDHGGRVDRSLDEGGGADKQGPQDRDTDAWSRQRGADRRGPDGRGRRRERGRKNLSSGAGPRAGPIGWDGLNGMKWLFLFPGIF
jgi:hypothetical protein